MSAAAWETVIGIEVHVQLRTATKMFCGCRSVYGAPPNTHVCPVCLGLPGALPVPNAQAVRLAVRAALALGALIRRRSAFDRKNYFYPDLPKGYQITQFAHPIARDGCVHVATELGEREIRVRRLHLEEDAGKSLHDRYEGATAVDLNRAGVPLIEIVTEPDLRDPAEARSYLTRLKQILEHFARVSDCNMEEGSLRVDANLSVRRAGEDRFGTKTEVKNLNSFGNVERALAFERKRQIAVLEAGGEVVSETRLYDPVAGETRPMRGKEEAFDYRYFPEPDLPVLEVSGAQIDAERAALPELPRQLETRLVKEYALSLYNARLLAAYPERATYFEQAARGRGERVAKAVANLIMGELAAELNRRERAAVEGEVLPAVAIARLAELRVNGTLSARTAGRAFELLSTGAEGGEGDDEARVDALVREHGLAQVQDNDQLEGWVREVLESHPEEAARLQAGEEKLRGFFMGQVMKLARGKADPVRTKECLARWLEEHSAADGPD